MRSQWMCLGLALSLVAMGPTVLGQAVQTTPAAQAEPPNSAQAPPTHATAVTASEATYSGCVMESAAEKGTYVLSADAVCAKLTGKLATGELAGHEIDLKGVLTPRVARTAASIAVNSVDHVGKSCSDVCSLRPPGTRGLGGERPGREGGRPGATSNGDSVPQ